jgi:hypothetical protein
MNKKILEKIYASFFILIICLGAVELYYVDFLFFEQPMYFAFKYLHIPSLVVAYLLIRLNSYVESTAKSTSKKEFWLIVTCAFIPIYFSASIGAASMYNRLIGEQRKVILKVELLEDVKKNLQV